MDDGREAYKGMSIEKTPIEKRKMTGNSCDSGHFLMECVIELPLVIIHTVFAVTPE